MLKKSKTLVYTAILALFIFLGNVFAQEIGYVNTYALKVRKSLSMTSKVISVLYKGDKVTVIEPASNGWKKIQLQDGAIGYVNGKYLDFEDELDSQTKTNLSYNLEKGENLKYYEVTSFRANIRSLSNIDKKIGTLNQGDKILLTDLEKPNGFWMQIMVVNSANPKLLGVKGYIGKNLVKQIENINQELINESKSDTQSSSSSSSSSVSSESINLSGTNMTGTLLDTSSSSSSSSSVSSDSAEEILNELFNF